MALALGCLPSGASVAASCFGSLACTALTKGNTSDYRVSKLMAVILQITSVTLILVLQSTDLESWLRKIPGVRECGLDNACYSLQIAYRLGFTTACVFAFHIVLGMLGRCFANKALNSFWVFKFVYVIAGSLVALMIPNKWFVVWAGISNVALAWFLLIQMVWVLDFGYSWNDLWLSNAAEDKSHRKSGTVWYVGLGLFACIFLAAAYTWYSFQLIEQSPSIYRYSYSAEMQKEMNRTLLYINIGASSFLGLMSMFSGRGGILPASLLILYIAWLSWSCIFSAVGIVTTDTRLAVGMSLGMTLMIYASYQTHLPQTAKQVVEQVAEPTTDSENEQVVTAPSQDSMEKGQPRNTPETKPEEGSWKYITFMNTMHLSAACYFMNLCISWTHSPIGESNMISYWVQACASWVMLILYAWTLVAPCICNSRQF